MKSNEEAHAKLLIRSYLNKGGINMKLYVTPLIIAVVVIAMTIFKSVIAYNLALFASPFLVVIVWAIFIANEAGCLEVSTEKGLSNKFINIFYPVLVALLAGFGHWWLASCWVLIWIGAWLNRQLCEEKRKELKTDTTET